MQGFAGNTVRAAEPAERPSPPAEASGSRPALRTDDLCGRGEHAQTPLPMLELALDRLPDILARRLGEAWKQRAVAARGTARGFSTFARIGAEEQGMRLVALFRVDGVGGGRIVLPAQMVGLLLDAMLGGSGTSVERQRFSHLDRCLLRAPVDHLLAALVEAFAPAGAFDFAFEGWRDALEDPSAQGPALPVLRQRLVLAAPQGEGRIDVLMPITQIEKRLGVLARPHPGDKLGADRHWRERLQAEVRQAKITVEAVLFEGVVDVGRIRALRPGDSFSFGLPPNSLVNLRAGVRDLAKAQLGKSGPMAAVRFDSAVAASMEPRS